MPIELPTSRDGLTVTTSPLRDRIRRIQNNPRLNQIIYDVKIAVNTAAINAIDFYLDKSPLYRTLIELVGMLGLTAGILVLIFHNNLFEVLLWFADSWRDMKSGPLIMFLLITIISFPPLIGYSALASLCGMMYGFKGWIFLVLFTVVGSLLSFLACRYLFKDYALRLARSNQKFAALTQTMESDGFHLLWMIRLCPLPYSLSNGALATIPSVTAVNFVLATIVTSPKLFMHIFIGDRIAKLGTEKDFASRVVDIVSVLIAVTVGTVTAYTIYSRTMERAAANDTTMDYSNLELNDDEDRYVDDDDSDSNIPDVWDDRYVDDDNEEITLNTHSQAPR